MKLTKEQILAVLERLQQFSYTPSYSTTDPDRYPHSNRYFFSANQHWLNPHSNHPVYGGFDNLDNVAQIIFELKHEDK